MIVEQKSESIWAEYREFQWAGQAGKRGGGVKCQYSVELLAEPTGKGLNWEWSKQLPS